MSVGGYVLAGGNSSRMGTDKALLQIDGIALAQQTAALVREAAGNATLVGDPTKYGGLGIPVIPDLRPGNGPLAGMEAALLHSNAEWNLIVACDMACLRVDFLAGLCARALDLPAGADGLVPCDANQRRQPLSAIYRRRCLTAFSAALDAGTRKVTEVIAGLNMHTWEAPDPLVFQNMNTPEEWNRYVNGRTNRD
jgi:molybdopterin-guanine dinucleotide biosynthesis protein A